MTEKFKALTVDDLHEVTSALIKMGYGGKTVVLSVNYDRCDHLQDLGEVYSNGEDIGWVTLKGVKE